ncbi:hypothetical protein VTH82DRAFT_6037 [Thermothelomyces myriococcoides]
MADRGNITTTVHATSDAKPDQFADPLDPTSEELAALPHDNAGPKLNAVIWMLTALSGVFLILRIYCRASRRRSLWWDDGFLVAARVCITVESALLTYVTTYGYGKHIWDFDAVNDMPKILIPMNVAGTLSVTAAIWSKTSFGITLLQITDGWIKKATWVIIITMNIAMGLSALFPWVNCAPVYKVWNMYAEGTCWDPKVMVKYNIFSGVYSACADIALALFPWKIIWGVHMHKKEKIGVGIAMSMGILAGITGLVKVSMIPRMLSDDFADGVELWLWGNAETTVTIIAASIPMLRVMLRDATNSRRAYGSTDYYKDNGLELRQPNTRVVTITSGAATRDVEMAKHLDDNDSGKGILDDAGDKFRNERFAGGIHELKTFTGYVTQSV